MNELVEIMNNEVVTTSKQVADIFEKEHRNVMRDIRNLIQKDVQGLEHMFLEDETTDSYGRTQKQFLMNRDGFTILTMGFTGQKAVEFKIKYIKAFNQMEEELKNNGLNKFANLPLDEQMLMVMNSQKERMKQIESDVSSVSSRIRTLEDNTRIDSDQSSSIQKAVRHKVYEVIAIRNWCKTDKEITGKLFSNINGDINQAFGVNKRGMLKSRDYDAVMEFISEWQPSSVTILKNKQRMDQIALEV